MEWIYELLMQTADSLNVDCSLSLPECHHHSPTCNALADGLGITVDAPYSKDLQRLLSEVFTEKKPVAAVGHGVAALLNAKITDPKHPHAGMPIVYGKQVGSSLLRECPAHL